MKNDKITLEIKNYILRNRLIEKGDCVLVGLSGGPDSVFLLEVLNGFRKSMDFRLFAVHVHHGIRGEEADRDERFSQELCRERDIPFKVVHVDAPKYAKEKGLSLEEAARILRYEAFEAERKNLEDGYGSKAERKNPEDGSGCGAGRKNLEDGYGSKAERKNLGDGSGCGAVRKNLEDGSGCGAGSCRIAVAHHMDDQAETVLHNLVRGSGIKGLSGMEARRGVIIRPLLSVKREYILRKLQDEGIPYVMDSTNLETQYTRNRIRTSVLPELKEINPEAASHIAKTADILREADDFFRKMASDYVDRFQEITSDSGAADRFQKITPESGDVDQVQETTSDSGDVDRFQETTSDFGDGIREISIPVEELKTYPELVRQYVMMELVRRTGTPLKDWSTVHFRDMDKLIHGKGGAHLDLPYRMSADYRKKHLILRINQEILSIKRRKNNG
ncbi:tRNA lysidine(34) synthetase [Oribacterium sp. FC2011]|uniref:tRNA lysidine(34) synthetase n=1 Tax=Oribacterium sp. FC2011 TaxID=1408311 RepID=UPI000AD45EB7|nr:tRNA lysidine(34) synthetase [Oribacterium sp. FC2011]